MCRPLLFSAWLGLILGFAPPLFGQETAGLTRLGQIRDKRISESSGLARARHPDAIWTINDSGNPAELFLLGLDGSLIADFPLKGVRNRDWEALSRFDSKGRSWLVVGDVGDNMRRQDHVSLFITEEPDPAQQPPSTPLTARRIQFMWEGGPRDCEALAVEPGTETLWLIDKRGLNDPERKPTGIFQLNIAESSADSPLIARRVADVALGSVTGMDFSPDGNQLLVRSYFTAVHFQRKPGQSWEARLQEGTPSPIALPLQRQGEAVCFDHDNRSVILSSEKSSQPLWRLDLAPQLSPAEKKESAAPHKQNRLD